MKKFFSLLICINLTGINSIALFAETIKDEFAAESLDKNLIIKENNYSPIKDTFAQKSLNQNLKIEAYKETSIRDSFAQKSLKPHLIKTMQITQEPAKYDFKSTNNKVKLSPLRYYSTKDNLREGNYIDFVLVQDIEINGKIYKRGTGIKARVENVSQNGAYGVPADLVVDNFVLANNIKLEGNITQKGADRTIWVYPASLALSPFFGIGLLVLAIRGGHAKLSPSKVYEIEGF